MTAGHVCVVEGGEARGEGRGGRCARGSLFVFFSRRTSQHSSCLHPRTFWRKIYLEFLRVHFSSSKRRYPFRFAPTLLGTNGLEFVWDNFCGSKRVINAGTSGRGGERAPEAGKERGGK